MRRTIVEHRGSRRFALVLLAAGSLVLAGCSSSSPVDPPPPASSAPTTSIESSGTAMLTPTVPPTASPAVYKPATDQGPAENVPVPVLPDKAKEFSKEGLIAFAEYWYSTLGYAYETGNVTPLQVISDPTCSSCQRVEASVGQQYGAGGWLVGGHMVVHQASSTFNEMADGTYQAVLTIQQKKVTAYAMDGTVDSESDQTIARPDIVMASFSDGRWIALRVEHLTKD